MHKGDSNRTAKQWNTYLVCRLHYMDDTYMQTNTNIVGTTACPKPAAGNHCLEFQYQAWDTLFVHTMTSQGVGIWPFGKFEKYNI